MLKTRAALPIAGLKGDILQLLSENNVLVVCGETGSGKTTQVEIYLSLVLHYYDFGIVVLFEVLRLIRNCSLLFSVLLGSAIHIG